MTAVSTIVITLVHGTWARNARWIRHGSSLRRALESGITPQPVIEVFEWSGRNSFSARLEAAKQLSLHLRHIQQRDTLAVQYVVTHSHGGNVALYAAKDQYVRAMLAGIICLATPFVHVRRRNWGQLVGKWTLMFLGAIASAGTVLTAALNFGMQEMVKYSEGVAFGIVLALCGAVIAGYVAKIAYRRIDHWRSGIELPTVPFGELLIVRSTGDEASAALATSQFISFLLARLWRTGRFLASIAERLAEAWLAILRPLAVFRRSSLNIALGIVLILLGWLVVLVVPVIVSSYPVLWQIYVGLAALTVALALFRRSRVAVGPFLSGALLLFLGPLALLPLVASVLLDLVNVLLILPLGVGLSIPLVFYGWELLLAGILCDVSVGETPPGSWRVHHLRDDAKAEGLTHSATYDDPRATRLVTEWIAASALRTVHVHKCSECGQHNRVELRRLKGHLRCGLCKHDLTPSGSTLVSVLRSPGTGDAV